MHVEVYHTATLLCAAIVNVSEVTVRPWYAICVRSVHSVSEQRVYGCDTREAHILRADIGHSQRAISSTGRQFRLSAGRRRRLFVAKLALISGHSERWPVNTGKESDSL